MIANKNEKNGLLPGLPQYNSTSLQSQSDAEIMYENISCIESKDSITIGIVLVSP